MSKLIEKIPGISAIVMVLVSFTLVLLMYIGGDAESILDGAGEALAVPKFTDALLYWTYALMGLILLIAVLMVAINYAKTFISDPMGALKSLIPIALFVLIFVVAWNLGTGEKMSIIGYEGTENEGFWAQFTDMVIYSLYALFISIGATIVGSRIYVSLK